MRLRMRMRTVTRPENALANVSHQISNQNVTDSAPRIESAATANAHDMAKISFS